MSAPDRFDVLLDQYLAGELAGATLAEFNQLVASHAEFQHRLAVQSEIATALRRSYAPPADAPRVPSLSGAGHGSPAEPPAPIKLRQGRRMFVIAAVAAVLLLAAGGVYIYVSGLLPESGVISPDKLYNRLVTTGFTPQIPCTVDEFPKFVKNRFGVPLVASVTPTSGVDFRGWGYKDSYGTPLGDQTAILYVMVGEAKVLVLMDRVAADRTLSVPASSGLKLFRREVSGMVFYEISPLPEEHVLPLLAPAPK